MSISSHDDDDDDDDECVTLLFNAILAFFFIGDESEFDDDCIERLELSKDIDLIYPMINFNGLKPMKIY